ncbi:MAG: AraC family transcriptional regulator, partial [Bacteroidota bacterium]
MQHFKTLAEYCQAIRIPPSRNSQFDIRTFQENMPHVVAKMSPFKHEFYSIALKKSGSGHAVTGAHQTAEDQDILFFNSPYQVLSWSILPDWEGYYIMFTKSFLSKSTLFKSLLLEFPFLRMDKAVPFVIDANERQIVEQLFDNIYQEYHENHTDQMRLLQAQTYLLLNYVKRFV